MDARLTTLRAYRRAPPYGNGVLMNAAERIEYMRETLIALYLRWLEEGELVR